MTSRQDLKSKILKGGISLAIRQVLVTILSLANVLVVARILGTEDYGIASICLGIFYFLIWTSRAGLHIYIVRQPDLTQRETEQILSFYNTVGVVFSLLLAAGAPIFELWTGQPEVVPLMRVLMIPVWLDKVASVPLGMLQRDVRFAEVGVVEAASQLITYAISVILVLVGWGYWGPIAGTTIGFLARAVMAYIYHPVRFRFRWAWSVIQPALWYGLTFTSSNAIRNTKNLIVPILVSRIAGASAVGIVSVAIRLAQQLAMFKTIVRDMSISIMAKMIDNPTKVRNSISRGMTYQALITGLLCASFSCVSAWIIPLLFGDEWLISTQIFPFIAMGFLVSAIFDLHTSTMHAIGHNNQVTQLYLLYIGSLWIISAIALNFIGLWGYGIAEIAALPSFFFIHRALSRTFGSPDYRQAFWLCTAAAIPLFAGIFVDPLPAIGLMILSYGTLWMLNAKVREIPKELLAVVRSRKGKPKQTLG